MSKILTMLELQTLTPSELSALHRQTRDALTRSTPGSAERRNALASLENINRAIVMRLGAKPSAL